MPLIYKKYALRFLVIWLLAFLFVVSESHAETVTAQSNPAYCKTYLSCPLPHLPSNGAWRSTPELACAVDGAYTYNGTNCRTSTNGFAGNLLVDMNYSCPSNASLVNGTCIFSISCVAPLIRNLSTGGCESPPANCVDGSVVSSGPYQTDTAPTSGCLNGCTVLKVTDAPPSINCSVGGAGSVGSCSYVYNHHFVQTSAQCGNTNTITTPAQANLSSNTCAECQCMQKGMSWGTVNGSVLCVARGSTGSHDVTVTTPPVKTTTTPAPTVENPNPTPVTTEAPAVTVTIKGSIGGSASNASNPMVEQTVKNPDGSTSTTTATKDDFCASNPTSKLCADTKTDCDKYPDSVACLTKDQLFGTADTADLPPAELTTTELTAPSFSAISMPSNSTCPAPQSMVIAGHTITVSYQWICDYASAFKALLIAFSLMTAMSIVIAGIRNDGLPYQRGLF